MEELTEKEQLEKFREWWKEYGNFVIGGIVLGIAIMVGISQWKSRTIEGQIAASAQFEALMSGVDDGDLEAAQTMAGAMYDDHGSSVYTAQARLAMARLYMDKGRDEDAAETLRGMLDSDEDSEIQRVGRLRLAKVLLYQNKPADVIDLLQGITDSEFLARYSELLGDAYVAMGRNEDAAAAYSLALSDDQRLPTVDQSLLKWKIVDLPEDSAEQGSDDPSSTAGEGEATEAADVLLESNEADE